MTNRQNYVGAILALYTQMPGAAGRICRQDRALAQQWFDRQIPIHIVETALLLGSARRLFRRAEAPNLTPIRSMAYFGPVVEDVVAHPPPSTYMKYLRFKLGFSTPTAPMDQVDP